MFEFLDVIGTIFGSAGFGALTGGIFGWLNRREDRKARASDQAHDLAMVQAQANAGQQTSEARAFEESQKSNSPWADFIKAIVRPAITGVLMYLTWDILVQLETLTGGISTLPGDMVISLYRDIVLNIICLTTMSISWWFASRPTAITKRS